MEEGRVTHCGSHQCHPCLPIPCSFRCRALFRHAHQFLGEPDHGGGGGRGREAVQQCDGLVLPFVERPRRRNQLRQGSLRQDRRNPDHSRDQWRHCLEDHRHQPADPTHQRACPVGTGVGFQPDPILRIGSSIHHESHSPDRGYQQDGRCYPGVLGEFRLLQCARRNP